MGLRFITCKVKKRKQIYVNKNMKYANTSEMEGRGS